MGLQFPDFSRWMVILEQRIQLKIHQSQPNIYTLFWRFDDEDLNAAYCYKRSRVVCQVQPWVLQKWRNCSWCCMGCWLGWATGPKKTCIRWGSDPHERTGNFEGEKGPAQDMRSRRYTESDSTGGRGAGMVWMPSGVYYIRVHTGATLQIRLNHPCVAAMQPCQITWTTC